MTPAGRGASAVAATTQQGFLGLSATGLLGGVLAAVSAAALGARLGLAGTVGGAALGSLVSALATAAYTHSLRTTRTFIRTRQTTLRAPGPVVRDGRVASGRLVRRIALSTAVMFAVVLITVTGIELGIGRSFDGGGSTTVGQVSERAGSGRAERPGPSSSPTEATSAESPSTDESTPSSTTSGTPSDTSSTSDQQQPTSTGTPSSPSAPPSTPATPEPTDPAPAAPAPADPVPDGAPTP